MEQPSLRVAPLNLSPRRPMVRYPRNPIFEVICAITFPPILELQHNPPAGFQRRLADKYPFVDVQETFSTITVGQADDSNPVRRLVKTSYIFSDETKMWRVAIEPTLCSLSCSRYSDWPTFRSRLEFVLMTLSEMYSVGFISRLGLRFRDVIDRSAYGLDGHAWQTLIEPQLLGTFLYFTDDLESEGGMSAAIELAIPPGIVKIQLAKVTNSETKKVGMLIDTDCFVERDQRFERDSVLNQADFLHGHTNLVFQACITDKLHNALLSPTTA